MGTICVKKFIAPKSKKTRGKEKYWLPGPDSNQRHGG
jgi:hypothetical protein